jgi:hypothetical protein
MTWLLYDVLKSTRPLNLFQETFKWPQMWKFVKEFIHICDMCGWRKTPHHQPYGLLQSLPFLESLGLFPSMNFIIDLPCSKSYYSTFVVVDQLTKVAHFISTNKIVTNEGIIKKINVYRYHDFPLDIVLDQGF